MQNYPVLYRASGAVDGTDTTRIWGRLNSQPDASYTIQVFAGPSCRTGEKRLLDTTPLQVTTDAAGDIYFTLTADELLPDGTVLIATATDANFNTSEYSDCVVVGIDNDSWPRAQLLDVSGGPAGCEPVSGPAGPGALVQVPRAAEQPDLCDADRPAGEL